MTELSHTDMMAAVKEGVDDAFTRSLTKDGYFDLSHELIMDAITKGVEQAVWRMITNATHMPTADFFQSVEDGVAKGMARIKAPEE